MTENLQELGGEKSIQEKAIIKLHELQSEIDEVENKPYKYILSTEDGKILLSHEANSLMKKCVELSDEEEAVKILVNAIESGNLQI